MIQYKITMCDRSKHAVKGHPVGRYFAVRDRGGFNWVVDHPKTGVLLTPRAFATREQAEVLARRVEEILGAALNTTIMQAVVAAAPRGFAQTLDAMCDKVRGYPLRRHKGSILARVRAGLIP